MQLSVKLPNLKVKTDSQMLCHILFEKLDALIKIAIFFSTTFLSIQHCLGIYFALLIALFTRPFWIQHIQDVPGGMYNTSG
jgi:hypothetical protein